MNKSNPMNEVQTKYSFYNKIFNFNQNNSHEYSSSRYFSNVYGDTVHDYEHKSTDQNLLTFDPISKIDNDTLNEYRYQIEQLKAQTDSTNAALEAALVPNIEPTVNSYVGDSYVVDDKLYLVDTAKPEYVYKVDNIKFTSDKYRKLSVHHTIHIVTQKGQTMNNIAYKLWTQYKTEYSNLTPNEICNRILAMPNNYEFVKYLKEYTPRNTPNLGKLLDAGIVIDTGLRPTVNTLIQMGYIEKFLCFVNNRMVSWDNMMVYIDGIDTYVAIDGSKSIFMANVNPRTCKFMYVNMPIGFKYISKGTSYTPSDGRFEPIFWFNPEDGLIKSKKEYANILLSNTDNFTNYDRILLTDTNIKYYELDLYDKSYKWDTAISGKQELGVNTTGILDTVGASGVLYYIYLREIFNEYQKLKSFNFMCFEDISGNNSESDVGMEFRDDYSINVDIFNITRVRFNNINSGRRIFKIFYNKNIEYNQDNFLRIPNLDSLYRNYVAYIKRKECTMKKFLSEVYRIIVQDIGGYVPFNHDVDKYGAFFYDLDSQSFDPVTGKVILGKFRPAKFNENEFAKLEFTDAGYLNADQAYYNETGLIRPVGYDKHDKYPSYINREYNHLKFHLERVYLDNMEEGATPIDEFIYYENLEAADILREIAYQMFGEDTTNMNSDTAQAIIETRQAIDKMILNSYKPNYFGNNYPNQELARDEWLLRLNVHEMFVSDDNDDSKDILKDMSKLSTPFDFEYSDWKHPYTYKKINSLDVISSDQANSSELFTDLQNYCNTNFPSVPLSTVVSNNDIYAIYSNGKYYKDPIPYSGYGVGTKEYFKRKYINNVQDIPIDEKKFFDRVFVEICSRDCHENTLAENYNATHSIYKYNLMRAVNYILSYDADKIETAIKKPVVSKCYLWKDVKNKFKKQGYIEVPRIRSNNINYETYCLPFLNGKLMECAYLQEVNEDSIIFRMNISVTFNDNDELELIYFLDVNNRVMDVTCTSSSMDYFGIHSIENTITELNIPCNTNLYTPEELIIFTNKTPETDNFVKSQKDYINYLVKREVASLVPTLKDTRSDSSPYTNYHGDNKPYMKECYELDNDYEFNGSYRVSKSNIEEYYIKPQNQYVNPYKNDELEYLNTRNTDDVVDNESYFNNTDFKLASSKQFRFYRSYVNSNRSMNDAPYTIYLPENFYTCPFEDHYIVVRNGRILSRNVYKVIIPGINIPDMKPQVMIFIELETGDRIDIVYLPVKLINLSQYYDHSTNRKYVGHSELKGDGRINFYSIHDQNQLSIPYGTLQHSSKDLIFMVMNGSKVASPHIVDVTDTGMRITSNRNYGNFSRLELYTFVDNSWNEYIFTYDGLTHEFEDKQGQYLKSVGKFISFPIKDLGSVYKESELTQMYKTNNSTMELSKLENADVLDGNTEPYIWGNGTIYDNEYNDQEFIKSYIAAITATTGQDNWIHDDLTL